MLICKIRMASSKNESRKMAKTPPPAHIFDVKKYMYHSKDLTTISFFVCGSFVVSTK